MPVYNEEEVIEEVVSEWIPALRLCNENFTLCILNDGSTDRTATILNQLKLTFKEIAIVNKENTGHGQTCILGYRNAIQNNAEWVLQIDSDGQCDPTYLEHFIQAAQSSPVVYGYRRKRHDGVHRKLISLFTSLCLRLATGVPVSDANVPYRLMHNSKMWILDSFPSDIYLANIFLAAFHQRNTGIQWVEIEFRKRLGGQSSGSLDYFILKGVQVFKQMRRHRHLLNTEPIR